ncbi:MAG: hypothetical protein KBT64_11245 [Sulfitobacter litoralis]|nr:hypothetical protein [Sulfitobacter litoralis]
MSKQGIDRTARRSYIRTMRILLRLTTFCLSLALLSGVLAHDLAAANMSMEMSGLTTSAHIEQDDDCTACLQDDQGAIVCDIDCTAPVFLIAQLLQPQPETLHRFAVPMPKDLGLSGTDPASDPFPPRTISLI